MADLVKKVTELQDIAKALDALRGNLKKLGSEKRTQDTLLVQRNKAIELWSNFVAINNKIIDDPGLPTDWEDKVKSAQAIYDDIVSTLEKFGFSKKPW